MIQHVHHLGHTLTWEEHSPGEHTFIFIHGYSANRAIWAREVAALSHLGRCVTLDLPGHFPAQAPPGYRSLTQADLIALELRAIEAIAGQGTCTIIGHSTGGLVALAAAARLPGRIRRVVCLSPVVWGPLTGVLGLYQRLLPRPGGYAAYWLNYWLTQRSRRYIQLAIGAAYSGDPWAYLRNPVAAEAVRRWHPTYASSSISSMATLLLTLRRCDVRAEATRVRCPVLVIAGAADPVVPVAQARWLAEHLPEVELRALLGVGHLPQWEAAETVERVMRRWLAAHPALTGAASGGLDAPPGTAGRA
jgi:pimeloyl-ACP methyl ester carboxylesterase